VTIGLGVSYSYASHILAEAMLKWRASLAQKMAIR
jgi:hypothetical protein